MKSIVQKQTIHLLSKIASLVAPPPKLTVSEWADKHRVLSKESSAEHGKWNTDRAPYQREIMDSINNPYELFNTVLAFLVLIGVVVDPTTSGTSDSEQALGYNKPRDDLEDNQ